jgi:hypothetical protein
VIPSQRKKKRATPLTRTMAAMLQAEGRYVAPGVCTGHWKDGHLSHNGDTCPVHEQETRN